MVWLHACGGGRAFSRVTLVDETILTSSRLANTKGLACNNSMRLIQKIIFAVPAFLFCQAVYGAGGACPTSASYLNTSNPAGPVVSLSSLGITSCYYIAASGSDSNNGTSESTPWLHAPGMPNCSNTCSSVTPVAAEGFIFRGGDTWHVGNSSAPPYVGSGGWSWSWNGTSSAYIYIGIDPGWYSGSAWARPILNADNATSTSPVSSCSYVIPSGNILVSISANYFIFDDFELTGMCWNNNTYGDNFYIKYGGVNSGNANYGYIQNNYVHGWTHTSGGTQSGGSGITDYNQAYGAVFRFNVIDGSDSDDLSLQAWGQGSAGYDLAYNITRYVGATTVFDECHIQHDNLFEYISEVTDGSTHSDVDFCYGEYPGGTSDPNIFYNNIFRYIGTIGNAGYSSYIFTMDTPQGQTDYVFNNVFHDAYSTGNYNATCDTANNGVSCGPATIFNNTSEASTPSLNCCIFGNGTGTGVPSFTLVNDYWITNAGTSYTAVIGNLNAVTESTPVYQTLSIANAQGYTGSNDFSPTSSSNATVTASGTNETTGYCADSVLHNAAAETACTQGITGVSYNSTSHTVVYPAFTAVSRPPSGAWNIGAYQFGGAISPASPTLLTAIVQ